MKYGHIGRPTNEEVSQRKRIQILKILLPFLLVILLVLLLMHTNIFSSLTADSVYHSNTCPDQTYSLNSDKCVKTEETDSVLLGDANQDNMINDNDLTTIKNVMIGSNTDSLAILAADVNQDKTIDLLDYNEVVNYLMKQSTNSQIGTKICPLDSEYVSYKLENDKCIKTTVMNVKNKKKTTTNKSKEYKIIFDANGGKFAESDNSRLTKTIKGGLKYGTLPEISRKGYVFDGWYLDNKKITSNSIVTKSVTIKAKWIVRSDKVNITYDGNGGIIKKTHGKAVDKLTVSKTIDNKFGKLPSVKRNGYVFKGWFVGDTKIKESTVVEDEVIVKAKWESKTYTINLSSTHGKLSNKSIKVKYGEKVGNLPELSSYKQFEFVGWYTKKDGKGRKIDNNTKVTIKKNITLYAYWTRK